MRCVRLRPGKVKLRGLQVFVTQPRFQVIERSAVMVQRRCVSLPEVVQLELFAHWCRLARAWLLVCQRVSKLFNAVATGSAQPVSRLTSVAQKVTVRSALGVGKEQRAVWVSGLAVLIEQLHQFCWQRNGFGLRDSLE
jgi:hypothetical protein